MNCETATAHLLADESVLAAGALRCRQMPVSWQRSGGTQEGNGCVEVMLAGCCGQVSQQGIIELERLSCVLGEGGI